MVKTYLGQPSIRVTSDRYRHLVPRTAESIRDRLQETFQKTQTDRAADFLRRFRGEWQAVKRLGPGMTRPTLTAGYEYQGLTIILQAPILSGVHRRTVPTLTICRSA